MMQVAVVWPGKGDSDDIGYELLVDKLTEHGRVHETFYSVVRNWPELFLKDFSNYDAVLVHGISPGLWMPFFKTRCSTKMILHLSGVPCRKRYNLWDAIGMMLERRAVESADMLVADNRSLAGYLSETYGRLAEVIAYGGDHFHKKLSSVLEEDFLSDCHVRRGGYALAMCAVIPENNCDVILEAFSRSLEPLVFVGDWDSGNYAVKLKEKFGSSPNIHLLKRDYAPDIEYMAMKNCGLFVCGHGAMGTDPMLVGAMSMAKPVICYDTPSNRSATRGIAHYFSSFQDILRLVFIGDFDGRPMFAIAKGIYDWKYINRKYQALYER